MEEKLLQHNGHLQILLPFWLVANYSLEERNQGNTRDSTLSEIIPFDWTFPLDQWQCINFCPDENKCPYWQHLWNKCKTFTSQSGLLTTPNEKMDLGNNVGEKENMLLFPSYRLLFTHVPEARLKQSTNRKFASTSYPQPPGHKSNWHVYWRNSGKLVVTLYQIIPIFNNPFENIVGKVENADKQHILL